MVILAAAIVAVALLIHHNNQVAARKHAAAVAAAHARAQLVAQRRAAAQLKREKAAVAKIVASSERTSLVAYLQTHVKKMADSDIADGVLDGPIIKVQCEPATSADATATIATYSCIAATSQSGGTLSGYSFTGTINLNTDDVTWRLGHS